MDPVDGHSVQQRSETSASASASAAVRSAVCKATHCATRGHISIVLPHRILAGPRNACSCIMAAMTSAHPSSASSGSCSDGHPGCTMLFRRVLVRFGQRGAWSSVPEASHHDFAARLQCYSSPKCQARRPHVCDNSPMHCGRTGHLGTRRTTHPTSRPSITTASHVHKTVATMH
jgi:hypothetical protein